MPTSPEKPDDLAAGHEDGFRLSDDFGKSPKLSKADEAKYEKLYAKKWRQIRRWIDRGEENNDPCPLHAPSRMPGWWSRNMKWRIPAEIEQAAVTETRSPAAPSPDSSPQSTDLPPQDLPPPPQIGPKIDLESFDPEEGDRLRELKQIQAAKFSQLRDALRLGHECSAQESKYLKLSETIDKIETRVTERLKKRGLYILRDIVERDMAASAELLRQSHDAMVRRVLESCPSLTLEQRAEVAAAVEQARSSEQRMLCRLDSLSANDLLRDLAA